MTDSYWYVLVSRLLIIVLSLSHVTASTSNLNYTCLPGIHGVSPGVSFPRGDIFLEAGDRQILYCHLNPEHEYFTKTGGFSVADLVFKTRGGHILAAERINSTSIRSVYTAEAAIDIDDVECMVQHKNADENKFHAICIQRIHVGFRPQNLTGFGCVSDDWHSLNCTWQEPVNPIPTKYHLRFIEPGIKAHPKDCPYISGNGGDQYDLDNFSYQTYRPHKKSLKFCYLSLSTKPPYRQTVSTYTFYVNATNPLVPGGKIYKIPIDHYSIVKPGKAESVNLTVISSDELLLEYKVSLSMTEFPPGLIQRVKYKDEYSSSWEILQDVSNEDPAKDRFNVSIPDLKSYTNYTFTIQMISASADSANLRLWSDSVSVWSRTNASLPAHSPRINVGSFETLKSSGPMRTVLVYWKQLEVWERNGPNFTYLAWLPESTQFKPVSGDNSYVKISNLTNLGQEILLTSENIVGHAAYPSKLKIPQTSFITGLEPRSVTKVWLGDGRYRVAWRHPQEHRRNEVIMYTLFFCKDRAGKDRPYQCDGPTDWIEVPPDWIRKDGDSFSVVQTYDLELPENDFSYQIAVSANTQYQSSGMFWTTCTVIHNRVESKLTSVKLTAVKSTSIDVSWSLDCSDQGGVVYGYRIVFCIDESCESKDVTANHEEYSLQGLKPFTDYQVGVRIKNSENDSYGQLEYKHAKTLPDLPGSAPLAVKVNSVTANTVNLSWEPPVVPNGLINRYLIHYTYKDFKDKSVRVRTSTNGTNIELQKLFSYTRYDVDVSACTIIGCSSHKAIKGFVTAIGEPARPPPPQPKFTNSTFVVINWGKDFQLGAPEALRWELKILPADEPLPHPLPPSIKPDLTVTGNQNSTGVNLANLLPNWSPDCQNTSSNSNSFEFLVRAVVLDASSDTKYTGEWSKGASAHAYCTPATNWFLFIGVPIIVLVIGSLMLCLVRTGYKYWHDTTQFFGEVGKELDAKLVIQADNMNETVTTRTTEFELAPIKRDGNSGGSGGEGGVNDDIKDDDDSDTLLLEDSGQGGDQNTTLCGSIKPNRQKSESESFASSYLTSGCDSLLSRGISSNSSQLLQQPQVFNKQSSVNSSDLHGGGSTCSGYVSMTRTESDGSSSNNSSKLSQQPPIKVASVLTPSADTVSGGSGCRPGSRHCSGTNRPVSAGPSLPTVTSSSLLSALQSMESLSNNLPPVGGLSSIDNAANMVNNAPIMPLSGGSDIIQQPRSLVSLSNSLQESRQSPGYSLVMPSINTHSVSIANVDNSHRDDIDVANIAPTYTVGSASRPINEPILPSFGLLPGGNSSATTPTSLPAFTPPPGPLPPLRVGTSSSMTSPCSGLGCGPPALTKTPTTAVSTIHRLSPAKNTQVSNPGDSCLPTGSSSTGYTNAAVLSDSLPPSPLPPPTASSPPTAEPSPQPLSPSSGSWLGGLGERDRWMNASSSQPQQRHNYISVQQVQELRPMPNNSAYSRVETGLDSAFKSSESDFETKTILQP